MQALILAGGEGTRLRPLTTTVPKPVVPLVDRPFIRFMLDWLRSHGVDDVVMSCGHLASGVRNVLGDGTAFGIKLRYVEEPRPLGTGGALKFAEALLDERFLMLNGDVLTDIDLTAQIAQHEQTGARATLALTPVEDPSAYGLVRTRDGGEVTEFVEKPSPDQIDTHNISAGAYVLERSVLELLEPDEPASIERDVFPRLVGDGLYGYVSDGYWLDIGTPERYLQGTFDILEGTVASGVRQRMGDGYLCVEDDVENAGRIIPSALVESGCRIGEGTRIGGRVVLERGVTVGENTTIERAVVMQGTEIGAQLHAQRLHHRRRRADRRRLPRRRPERARRGRHDRRGQHGLQRRADVPRRDAARRRAAVLMDPALDAAAVAAVDSTGQVAEMLDLGDAPARRAVARRVGGDRARRRARRHDRRRHGRLGGRRPAGARRDRAAAAAAAGGRRRLRAAGLGRARHARAVLELLGHHRGDAVRLRRRGRARRAADRGHDRRAAAERARRDGVPVIPVPGGFQPRAAVGYSLVAALEAAALCGAAPSLRDEVEAAASLAQELAKQWGPDGPDDGEAKRLARRLHGTVPVIARRRARGRRRLPLEVPDQRERRHPAFSGALPGARPQRGRRAGPRPRAGCRRCSSRTRTRTRATGCASS